jgi:hypothetical protein
VIPISASTACSAGRRRSDSPRSRHQAATISPASRKRQPTLISGATGPSCQVIASQVVLQIATQPAKSVRLFRGCDPVRGSAEGA